MCLFDVFVYFFIVLTATAAALPQDLASLQSRGTGAASCGMATYSNTGTPLLRTWNCVNVKLSGKLILTKYNILEGCICFFFHEVDCDLCPSWTGWVGPARDTTIFGKAPAYMCRQPKPDELAGAAIVDGNATVFVSEDAGSLPDRDTPAPAE